MKISPLQAVDGIPFGATESQVVAVLGEPLRRNRNRLDEDELRYEAGVFRFVTKIGMVEASLNLHAIALDEVEIQFADIPAFLRENDSDVFNKSGFLVSPRYGVAVDSGFESWVTVMPTHRIAAWKAI